jgi:hypothetical protein
MKIARVLVRLDHLASIIVNANHSVVRTTAVFGISDCVVDRVLSGVPQLAEGQHIGNQIDAALVAARGALRKVLASGLDGRDYFDCSSRSHLGKFIEPWLQCERQ